MGNELQKQEKGVESVIAVLNSHSVKNKFTDILGGARAPAFISSIISAVSLNKDLKLCPAQSVISSAAIAATLDLPINPSLGMAHIVPYKDKTGARVAQFQMGWQGFIQLGMRTGKYQTMNIAVIHEGDIKSINRFTGDIVFNDSQILGWENRPVVGYLFYFRLVNGYEKYCYMTKAEAEVHGKKYSKSYATGNWTKDFDGMAKKTVVKMGLSKYGILSVEMQQAITTDQAVIGDDGNVIDYPDNDADEPAAIDTEVKIIQTPRQIYETLKLQLGTAGKLKEINEILKGHAEISGHDEKTWTEADLIEINKQMAAEVDKK